MNITFLGFGSMAKAIAQGLIAKGQCALSASSPSLTTGINAQGIKTYCNNVQAMEGAQVIILAVKPKQMAVILEEIGPHLKSEICLISVAAGLSLAWFERHCNKKIAIIRTMPNIPASVGLAATPMIANAHTTDTQKKYAEWIFSEIGIITWIQREAEMDGFTALSGSGPAYVFLFMEAMIAAAMSFGLKEQVVHDFTLQTLKGAITLAENSDCSLSQLRAKVTSAKGTTAAALDVLHNSLPKLMQQAMQTAQLRAKQLGQQEV